MRKFLCTLRVLTLLVHGICSHRKRTLERASQTSAELLPADTPSKANREMRLVAATWNNIYQVQFFSLESRWAIDQGSIPQSSTKSTWMREIKPVLFRFYVPGYLCNVSPLQEEKGQYSQPWHKTFFKKPQIWPFRSREALQRISLDKKFAHFEYFVMTGVKPVLLLRRNKYSIKTLEDWSLINMTDTDSVN